MNALTCNEHVRKVRSLDDVDNKNNVIWFVISIGLIAVCAYCVSQLPNSIVSLLYFLVFLSSSGVLLALISARLYRQHQMEKKSFDIFSLLLGMTLLAVAFGFGSHVAKSIEAIPGNDIRGEEGVVSFFILVGVVFLLYPILIVTERIVNSSTRFWKNN